MSGTVNKAILVGHLGADPVVRADRSGKKVATFSVATGHTWRDKTSGERKEVTYWHRIVIFNEKLAEVAEQYLKKGSKVYLEGEMQTRKWADQAGVDRYTTEVVMQGFNSVLTLLEKREGGVPPAGDEGDYGSQRSGAADGSRPGVAPRGGSKPAGAPGADMDDDIPF
jgi:single-strand DNA-binding protein